MPEVAFVAGSTVLLGLALVFAIAGMGWLALSLDSHWAQVHGEARRSSRQTRGLRLAGGIGLVTALVLCLVADHPSMAALVWIMVIAVAAVVIGMTLAWRPGWLRRLPVGGAAAS